MGVLITIIIIASALLFVVCILLITHKLQKVNQRTNLSRSIVSKIPRTIHQIYDVQDFEKYKYKFVKWANANEWKYELWTDKKCDQLLVTYPSIKTMVDKLPTETQKKDIIRYLILYEHGGVHMHTDTFPQPGFSKFMEDNNENFIAFVESTRSKEDIIRNLTFQNIRQGEPEDRLRISNYVMAASRKSPIVWNIIQLAYQRCKKTNHITHEYDLQYTSGSDVVTTIVNALHNVRISDEQQTKQLITHSKQY
jgi:mannosyltransferase OCH1-like enzyme